MKKLRPSIIHLGGGDPSWREPAGVWNVSITLTLFQSRHRKCRTIDHGDSRKGWMRISPPYLPRTEQKGRALQPGANSKLQTITRAWRMRPISPRMCACMIQPIPIPRTGIKTDFLSKTRTTSVKTVTSLTEEIFIFKQAKLYALFT
jgi:hypothetical protein